MERILFDFIILYQLKSFGWHHILSFKKFSRTQVRTSVIRVVTLFWQIETQFDHQYLFS